MRTQDSRNSRRPHRGPRRHSHNRRGGGNHAAPQSRGPAPKPTLWERIKSFFTGSGKPRASQGSQIGGTATAGADYGSRRSEASYPSYSKAGRKPEVVEVSSPKVYVGNLSFDAIESDLFDLFNGVGKVMNAEIVSHKYTQKSKGFAFVTMSTIEEARRAVEVLHDQDFMGRKLVVSGAKTSDVRSTSQPG
jgi:RNA recognition motif. (a.k.a. RRM, RBD, or RNP domain)